MQPLGLPLLKIVLKIIARACFLLGGISLALNYIVASDLAEVGTRTGDKQEMISKEYPVLHVAATFFLWNEPDLLHDLEYAIDKMLLQVASIGMVGLLFIDAGTGFLALGIEGAKQHLQRKRKKLRSKKT